MSQAFGTPTIVLDDSNGVSQLFFGSDRFELIARCLGECKRVACQKRQRSTILTAIVAPLNVKIPLNVKTPLNVKNNLC